MGDSRRPCLSQTQICLEERRTRPFTSSRQQSATRRAAWEPQLLSPIPAMTSTYSSPQRTEKKKRKKKKAKEKEKKRQKKLSCIIFNAHAIKYSPRIISTSFPSLSSLSHLISLAVEEDEDVGGRQAGERNEAHFHVSRVSLCGLPLPSSLSFSLSSLVPPPHPHNPFLLLPATPLTSRRINTPVVINHG